MTWKIQISTPMAQNHLTNKDEQGLEINIAKYIVIIGFMLYIITIWPSIMFGSCMCARF